MNIFEIDFLIFDYVIIILTIIIAMFCFWKGFLNSILGLLTWIGSVFITIYSYEYLSTFLKGVFFNIEFLTNFEQITSIVSVLISIPIIFLITLFILKRIRKILNNDLDKNILGLLFDKIFGAIYGLIFSYIVFSTLLYFINQNQLNGMESLNKFLIDNSNLLREVSDLNNTIIDNYLNNNSDT